ncbi:MAG TPA: hypothetical protein VF623_09550 [Segetibacter sp.]|jgi:hypothetical protein
MKSGQNKLEKPVVAVKVDKDLDRYINAPFAKKKLDKANEMLKKAPIPKEFLQQ